MKHIAFAAVALTVAACTASSPDDSAQSSDALTQTSKDASPITIDFGSKEVTNLQCNFNGGDPENYSVQFDFQGKHFSDTHHIDFWGCQNERDEMLGVHSGVIVHPADGSVTIVLDNGRVTFEAGVSDNVTRTTSAVTLLVGADAHCQVEMGWFIDFGFEGHTFQTYGADDVTGCNGRLSQLKDAGSLASTLVVEQYATYAKRTLTTNDGQWTFTSYEQI